MGNSQESLLGPTCQANWRWFSLLPGGGFETHTCSQETCNSSFTIAKMRIKRDKILTDITFPSNNWKEMTLHCVYGWFKLVNTSKVRQQGVSADMKLVVHCSSWPIKGNSPPLNTAQDPICLSLFRSVCQVVGLYRLCGSAAVKKELRDWFERNSSAVCLSEDLYPDINVITGQ